MGTWTTDGYNERGHVVLSHPTGAQESVHPSRVDEVLRSLNRQDEIAALEARATAAEQRVRVLEGLLAEARKREINARMEHAATPQEPRP